MKALLLLSFLMFTNILLGSEIKVSTLQSSKEARREKAFTQWMNKATFKAYTDIGVHFPIFIQIKEKNMSRAIFVDFPEEHISWQALQHSNLKEIQRTHEKYKNNGYHLVSIYKFESKKYRKRYSAVWVTSEGLETAQHHLKLYGIGRGEINDSLDFDKPEELAN